MPAPLSAPPPTHRSNALALAVSRQFSDRPTLRLVVEQHLQERLLEQFPSLVLDLSTVKLATPNQRRGWDLQRLTDVVLDHLGNGTDLSLTQTVDERRCFLSQHPPLRLTYEANGPREPNMAIIERLIADLAFTLPIAFQQALTTYWNLNTDTHSSRWQWLGDVLADNLKSTASLLPAGTARDMLYGITREPDRRERQTGPAGFIHAYCLEVCIISQGRDARWMSTDLLLVQGSQVLLCQTAGGVEGFASMEAFTQAWGQRLTNQLQVEKLLVNRYEPDSNLFDTQAALLLNQQLDDLEAIRLPAAGGVRALAQQFADATDPSPAFIAAPAPAPVHQQSIQAALPSWLQTASAEQRFAYRQGLVEQARLQRQTGGASFLDGVEDLPAFTTRTLREQMRRDHPESSVEPGNLVLTFHVPVGDLHSGYLAPVTMSLTELAINHLATAPQGRMTLRDTSGATIPDWLTEDYVLGEKGLFHHTPGLIRQVDIGQHYPQKMRELLLGDSPQTRQREVLFGQALAVQLPRQALELAIREQQGFTFLGYRYVKAVLHSSSTGRVVDAQDIVIRPLAFARKPGAAPDIVSNMFIIEPRDTGSGPSILYRPLYQDALLQLSSRAALLDAITQPGALQDSVLAWMSDKARPIYSYGGFHSPHILRFGQGDDTVQWPAPPPAQLAQDANGGEVSGSLAQSLATGNLTQYLYGSNARALVDLADQNSVSNAESRWAILLEGGWLLFNTLLLPLLRGPAMVAGWMAQLAVGLQHDLAALQGNDAVARELAWVDVLLNIGLILLHVASRPSPPLEPAAHPIEPALPLTLDALRRPPGMTHPTVLIGQGPVGLPAEPPAGDRTLVDFVHSNARDSSRRRLLDALRELHVPWPVPAPMPVDIGAFKGLYRIKQQWHASVAGLLFRVNIAPDLGEVFLIHPQKPDHPGFELTRDPQGRWILDLGLKLRGGGPKNRLKAKLVQIDQQRAQVSEEINRIGEQISALIKLLEPIDQVLDAARLKFEKAHNDLGAARQRLRSAPGDPALIADHRNNVALRSRARAAFQIFQERFDQAAAPLLQQRRELLKVYGQMKEADSRFDYEGHCVEQYQSILATDEIRVSQLSSLYLATFVSEQGESLLELQGAAHDAEAVQYVKDLLETNFAVSEQHAQAMIAIDNTLEDMAARLKTGPAQRLKYLNGNPKRRFYNRLNAILESLDVLTELSIDQTIPATTPEEHYFLARHEHLQTSLSSLEDSHLELLTTEGFSPAERKEVLSNLIKHYNRRLQIYQSLMEFESPLADPRYMPLLIDRLQTVRNSAEADLAALLREDEFLPPQPILFKPVRTLSRTKRVFNARDKGALVGELEPEQSDLPFPTIVTRNPITQQVSGRFMEHPNEGWVEIVEARPVTPVEPHQAPPLASLRTQAQRLLGEIPGIERSIEFQKKKLSDPTRRDELNPQDWRDMLAHQADRLETVATELANHHADKPDIPQTVERLRLRAAGLRTQGTQQCIEGYKAQRPRQENIEFLRTHAAIDIGLVHGPQRTAAKDFVSEFAVREKNSLTVLWYAHFHYSRADSPPTAYSAAHLKRPEQRFVTQRDLIAQAGADNQAIVRGLYNPITAPLDQRLFLSLLPA
ncbi:hypothetical protein [Pseudomonas sp. TAE6080]|uniref:hypothetical protein n=1 Tax=Pseudomonas sp. TAE6080 TaxID=2840374 RepID=UPI001C0089F9|nr:hypothetical protein [Pseudomonas sp. TAE6080]MBT9303419.1 hypothetical protein [Pseudomonas sp. TAE6080]